MIVVIEIRGEERDLELWLQSMGMKPQINHLVLFRNNPGADVCLWWNFTLAIGNLHADSCGVKTPMMKRALNRISLDRPIIAKVGTQMGAVRIQNAGHSFICAKENQIAAKIRDWSDLTRFDLIRKRDHEPTIGVMGIMGLLRVVCHHHSFFGRTPVQGQVNPIGSIDFSKLEHVSLGPSSLHACFIAPEREYLKS